MIVQNIIKSRAGIKNFVSFFIPLIFIGGLCGFGALYPILTKAAWAEPSGPPPSQNIGAPLNSGPDNQSKIGGLDVAGGVISSVVTTTSICLGNLPCIGDWSNIAGNLWVSSTNNSIHNSNSGNVGIGTSTPASKFIIQDGTGIIAMGDPYFNMSFASAIGAAAISMNGSSIAYGDYNFLSSKSDQSLYINRPDGYSIYFLVGRDIKQMTINPSGNVGIGTTTPTSNLYIGTGASAGTASPVNLSLGGTYSATAGANPKLRLYDSGGSIYGLGISSYKLDYIVPAGASHAFYVGGGEKMRVNSNGNVGIGTTTPVSKLTVVGGGGTGVDLLVNGRLKSDNNNGGLWISSDRFVGGLNTNQIGFYNNGSWRLVVNNSGNVGIGTTTPTSNLYIGTGASAGTASPVNLSLGGTYSATAGANPKLRLYDSGGSIYGLGVSSGRLDYIIPTGASHAFYVGGGEKMRVNSNGNVGIGTTSPVYKLGVNGSINGTQICISGVCKSAWDVVSSSISSQWTSSTNGGIYYNSGNVGIGTTTPVSKLSVVGTNMSFRVGNNSGIGFGEITSAAGSVGPAITAGDGSATFFIRPWGQGPVQVFDSSNNPKQNFNIFANVGIGTTTPTSNLYIGTGASAGTASPVNLSLGGTYSATAGTNAKLKLYDSGGSIYGLGVSSGRLDYIIPAGASHVFYVDGGEKMRINSNGNVGIGTTNPVSKLEIDMTNFATTEGLHISRDSATSHYSYLNIEDENINSIFKVHESGNIGIGTSSPIDKLTIVGSVANGGVRTELNNTNNTGFTAFRQDVGTNYGIFRVNGPNAGTDPNKAYISTKGNFSIYSSGTEALFVNTNGRVGVGTTTPAYNLGVNGSVGASQMCLGGNCITSWPSVSSILPAGTNGQTLRSSGTAWVANSNLYNNGTNVGVGTMVPAVKLDVYGDIRSSANITANGDIIINGGDLNINNNSGGISFNDASAYWFKTANDWGIYWDTANNQIKFNGGGIARSLVDLDDGSAYFLGNVGIGTTAPAAKLNVVGSVRLSIGSQASNMVLKSSDSSGSAIWGYITGASIATSSIATSDLDDRAITTVKIATGAVTANEIGDKFITCSWTNCNEVSGNCTRSCTNGVTPNSPSKDDINYNRPGIGGSVKYQVYHFDCPAGYQILSGGAKCGKAVGASQNFEGEKYLGQSLINGSNNQRWDASCLIPWGIDSNNISDIPGEVRLVCAKSGYFQ